LEQVHPKLSDAKALTGGILLLTYNDGQVRYMLSHQNQLIAKQYTSGTNFINGWGANWGVNFGNECKVQDDGSLIVNDGDRYTPEELWENSSEHIPTMPTGF
jgi:hypothetical protein